ncbi:MAG: hypothetical protein MUQ64_06375, partial [Paracoccaceae bacterium]|nr:hypothetical protein [Paracoccaceae bacterium]
YRACACKLRQFFNRATFSFENAGVILEKMSVADFGRPPPPKHCRWALDRKASEYFWDGVFISQNWRRASVQ